MSSVARQHGQKEARLSSSEVSRTRALLLCKSTAFATHGSSCGCALLLGLAKDDMERVVLSETRDTPLDIGHDAFINSRFVHGTHAENIYKRACAFPLFNQGLIGNRRSTHPDPISAAELKIISSII